MSPFNQVAFVSFLLISLSSALDVHKISGLLAVTMDHWRSGLNFNFVADVDDEEAVAALIVSTMSSSDSLSSQDSPWNIVYDNKQDHIDLGHTGHKVSLILVTPRNRLSFRDASTSGIMKKGVWVIPHHLMDPYQVKSRFDSNIITYNLTNNDIGSNSTDRVGLSEVFSVKDSHKFVNNLGYWSEEEGLVIYQPHIWERRQEFLKGVKLIGMHLPWPPYTYIVEDEYGNTTTYGILPDAIKMFQQIAGFEYVEVKPPDGNWGAPLDANNITGEWNGMIRELMEGRADFGHNPFATTLERSLVISYGVSIDEDIFTFTATEPSGAAINFLAYVDIFNKGVWICILLAVVVGSLAHFASAYKNNTNRDVLNSLGAISATYIQKETTASTERLSQKMMYVVNCVAGFVVFAFYSGVLTSLMTATPVKIGISSFEDVLNQDYQPIVLRESADSFILKGSAPGTVLYDIYKQKMEGNDEVFIESTREMIKMVQDDPRYVIFGAKSGMFGADDVVVLNLKEAIADKLSPAYPKDSELLSVFNHHFSKMEETGVLAKLKFKWLSSGNPDKSSSSSSSDQVAAEAHVLGYDNLFFPAMIIFFGTLFAFFLLACEMGANLFKPRITSASLIVRTGATRGSVRRSNNYLTRDHHENNDHRIVYLQPPPTI